MSQQEKPEPQDEPTAPDTTPAEPTAEPKDGETGSSEPVADSNA